MDHTRIIWFTGLSGAGKTTLACALKKRLTDSGRECTLYDGDEIRKLAQLYDFSREGRILHNKAVITELAKNATGINLVAMITPFQEIRELARKTLSGYFEIYVSTPLEICEKRDPKGLYKRARLGKISQFTGIDQAFDPPLSPDFALDTSELSVEESLSRLIREIDFE